MTRSSKGKRHNNTTKRIVGNWGGFVYIEVDYIPKLEQIVEQIVSETKKYIPGLFIQEALANTLHISLSKTYHLKEYQIQAFVKLLTSSVSDMRGFPVRLGKVKLIENEDATKTSLVIGISSGFEKLEQLVKLVDKPVDSMCKKKFYTEPYFHCSIAHTYGSLPEHIRNEVEKLSTKYDQDLSDVNIFVDQITCKAGNKFFRISLS